MLGMVGVGVLLGALLVLVVTMVALVLMLAVRRISLLRAERRRREATPRLSELGAALVMDGELPPPLSSAEDRLLAAILWDFSRQITGAGREEIAAYFERVKLVDRELWELRAGPAWRRARAAYVLGDACSMRAVPALIDRLWDRDSQVRAAACRSLGRLRASEAARPIAEALAERRLPRFLASTKLLEIGAGAVPALRMLCDDPDAPARATGAQLLGLLGSAGDAGSLRPLLSDPSGPVRAEACLALGRLGAGETVPQLMGMLRDADPRVRAAAADALGELQDEQALPELLRHAEFDQFAVGRAAAAAAARIDKHALAAAAARPGASPHIAEAAGRVEAAYR